MGCSASTSMSEGENDAFIQEKKANDFIEKNLQMEKQRGKNEIKILLLGTGESGKSTVLKQLKLLHHGGFTHEERLKYGQVIWADAIQSMKLLIIQARKFGIALDSDNLERNRMLFKCKHTILQAKALDYIDTGVAGGSEFLNDYVLKYSERSENKRRVQSTGRVEAFDCVGVPSLENGIDIQDVSMGLSDHYEDSVTSSFIIPEAIQESSGTSNVTKKEIAYAIKQLWTHDRGITQCFARANEFQLEGSASYYFENIENFAQPNYLCTDEDIIKGRIKTTGITETQFSVGFNRFNVLDAGGQRSERKKWIHCFQDITAVLFVLAVSEYDQMLFEDERVNRMHESIMLFDTLLNSKWFYNTPFILFFNKVDLFEEKVSRSPIRQYFPDYPGRVGDMEAGLKYFERIFLSLNRNKKPIYVHRTCATDTKSMKFVLSAVTDLIAQQNLKKCGML